MRTTTLYRLRDADGALLYVGISQSAMRRLGEHAASKSWWDEVARVDVEHFATRAEAVAAEWRAIGDENPRHNIDRRGAAIAPNPFITEFIDAITEVAS